MVLIVTAVMAAPPRLKHLWADIGMSRELAAAMLAVPALVIGYFCTRTEALVMIGAWAIPSLEREMAGVLFGPYALMTEAAGLVILLSALALIVAER
jgi:NADH:ubiquinone oxidoreductase subunit 6 (subunit J)